MAEQSLTGIGPVVLVGAGKMGLALAQGWVAAGLPPGNLVLVDPQPSEHARRFATEHSVRLTTAPDGVLVAVLVLAVKPQIMAGVLDEIRPHIGPHTLILSIAAGISIATLSAGTGSARVVRTMPNTPAQIGKGVTGAVAGGGVRESDRDVAHALMSAVGDVVWLDDEPMIDALTAISGSGPAYLFYFVEALATAAVRLGFDAEQAMLLSRQTVLGAAALMDADPLPAGFLRQNVTSPKGTTEAALNVLMGPTGLGGVLERATLAAKLRSEELGRRPD